MFYDNLKRELEKQGKKISPFLKEMGYSTSNATKWKSGNLPDAEILIRICKELNVSSDYLLGLTTEQQINAELINAYKKASPEIRSAVNVLLGLSEEAPKHADYRLAAYGGKGVIKDVPTEPKIT